MVKVRKDKPQIEASLFLLWICFDCRLTQRLEPVGFGVATVHTEHEKELVRKIGAKELPHLVLLIDGRVIHYKDSQFSIAKILEFVRRKFPYQLVESVNDLNINNFLDGWMDNRIRVLLFGQVKKINKTNPEKNS